MTVQISDLQKLYHTEYDQWLAQTIVLLKNRQLEGIDYEHLVEELEALGRSETIHQSISSIKWIKIGNLLGE